MTTDLRLVRVAHNDRATFGVLVDPAQGRAFAVTLERPWANNQPQVSCIPAGHYLCSRVDSPKFGDTFEVTGVPGRSHILFHKGNLSDDTHGCILVGEQFEAVGHDSDAVQASAQGFAEFLRRLDGKTTFGLEIVEA